MTRAFKPTTTTTTNRSSFAVIVAAVSLLLVYHLGTIADAFVLDSTSTSGGRARARAVGFEFEVEPSARPTPMALFQSTATATMVADTKSKSSSSNTTVTNTLDRVEEPKQKRPEHEEVFRNTPLAAPEPREFDWWNEACDTYIDELDGAGGERFVAHHDDPNQEGTTTTNNWLHVTSTNPSRRVQYEVRYVADTKAMGGVVRFGKDCEGPPGCAHGGSIATMADALTATCCFFASTRWGMTTSLNCNYRETISLGTPVKVEATVVDLKKRKASLEWSIHSLTKLDRKGQPIRHAFGTADFLLPRLSKDIAQKLTYVE